MREWRGIAAMILSSNSASLVPRRILKKPEKARILKKFEKVRKFDCEKEQKFVFADFGFRWEQQ